MTYLLSKEELEAMAKGISQCHFKVTLYPEEVRQVAKENLQHREAAEKPFKYPAPKGSGYKNLGWTICPEFISKVQDATKTSEGGYALGMVEIEAVLLALLSIMPPSLPSAERERLAELEAEIELAKCCLPYHKDDEFRVKGSWIGSTQNYITSLETRLAAYDRAAKEPVGIVEKVTESDISNDMWLTVVCEKGAPVTEYQRVYTAPPLPVVPDAITQDDAPELQEIAAEAERLGIKGFYGAFVVGANWMRNACRAAMLRHVSLTNRGDNYPAIPEGWVPVPVEPTYQMCEALGDKWESPEAFPVRYARMLAAVPQPGKGE